MRTRTIPPDNVPVEIVYQAVQDSGVSLTEIARRLGWIRIKPDTSKLRRAMGLRQTGGGRPTQKSVTYNRALEVIEAAGLEPVDYGL